MAQPKDKRLRDSILSFFQAMGMRERFEENLAIAYWDLCVGKNIARHTEPFKVVEGGILLVKVDDDSWRHELSFLKHQIIEKLNQQLGKKTIQEIKFY